MFINKNVHIIYIHMTKQITPELFFEELQSEANLSFLTLIEFKKVKYLTVIENIIGNDIQAYVIDHLKPEELDSDWFMSIAIKWFYANSETYPLSFELMKYGKMSEAKKILKTFNISSVSRIIGKLFRYDMKSKPTIKRKKVIPIHESVSISLKKN